MPAQGPVGRLFCLLPCQLSLWAQDGGPRGSDQRAAEDCNQGSFCEPHRSCSPNIQGVNCPTHSNWLEIPVSGHRRSIHSEALSPPSGGEVTHRSPGCPLPFPLKTSRRSWTRVCSLRCLAPDSPLQRNSQDGHWPLTFLKFLRRLGTQWVGFG